MGNIVKIQANVKTEIQEEKIFKELNEATDKIKQIQECSLEQKVEWDANLLKSIGVFYEAYFSFRKTIKSSYDGIQNNQRKAGQILSESKSISVICKVIMKGLGMGYRDEDGKTDTHQFTVISESLLILMNYSDCTPEVTYDIAGEPKFLETIKDILTKVQPDSLQDKAKDEDEKVMRWCLTIYYNVSTVDDNIPRLRSLDIVPVMKSFLDAQVKIYHLTALSTLANIIDENESTEIMQGKPDVIEYLLKRLGLALKDPRHRHLGWSAQECTRTVCKLARNDANKTLLVEMDCLPHLVKLAKIGNVEEKREAVRAIQILTFHKKNLIKIVNDKRFKIVDLLKEIKEKYSDKEITEAVDLTFWNLREELQNNNNYKHLVRISANAAKHSEDSSGRPVKDGKGRIMISYEQSNQEVLIKIRDILKDDYVVYMNNDNTIEVMAKAVEEAHVFLMCMSRKYKDKPSCQAEAEYAFQQKKKIIPLVMEKGYRPDGWLGMLLGAKLFFDFSGKYPFEEKIKDLKREISNSYRDEDTEPKVVPVKS